MIVKTVGICIRLDPFSKTSQVVTWLTPDQGRVVTIAKGAKRPKNAFCGQYDLFYTSEILFYSSARSAIHVLKECAALDPREKLRHDWRASASASYLCDVLNRMTPTGSAQMPLFDFSGRFLDFIVAHGVSPAILHWSELRLFHLLGVAPQLNSCRSCGAKQSQMDEPLSVSMSRGGVICAQCRRGEGDTLLAITPDVLSMLRAWQEASSPLIARRTACTAGQRGMMSSILGDFLRYHLESSSRARDIALTLVSASF